MSSVCALAKALALVAQKQYYLQRMGLASTGEGDVGQADFLPSSLP
jgi:hypothetical protein